MNQDHPGVRLPPPLIVLAGLAAGLALDGRPTELRFNSMPFVVLGITCAAVGLLLVLSALGLFHRKGTRPEPWKPSSSVVTSGVYRFTRNPMYLSMLLLYAGIALIWAGPWSATLFPLIFLILSFAMSASTKVALAGRPRRRSMTRVTLPLATLPRCRRRPIADINRSRSNIDMSLKSSHEAGAA